MRFSIAALSAAMEKSFPSEPSASRAKRAVNPGKGDVLQYFNNSNTMKCRFIGSIRSIGFIGLDQTFKIQKIRRPLR
jgi:hypothetical protein